MGGHQAFTIAPAPPAPFSRSAPPPVRFPPPQQGSSFSPAAQSRISQQRRPGRGPSPRGGCSGRARICKGKCILLRAERPRSRRASRRPYERPPSPPKLPAALRRQYKVHMACQRLKAVGEQVSGSSMARRPAGVSLLFCQSLASLRRRRR